MRLLCYGPALAAALLGVSCVGDRAPIAQPTPTTPVSVAGRPATLTILFGPSTKAHADETITVPVLVSDSVGRPVSGAIVSFETDVNVPGYRFPTVSDSNGIATAFVRVPTAAGDYTAEAAVIQTLPSGQQTIVTKRFVVYVRGGAVVRLVGRPGRAPATYQGGTLLMPAYIAYDRFNNYATTGEIVVQSVPGGSVPLSTVTPDSTGHVPQQLWKLGTELGKYSLILSVNGTTYSSDAYVVSGPPASIVPDSTPLIAGVNKSPVTPPAVLVLDSQGRGVPGLPVVWSDASGALQGCSSSTSDEVFYAFPEPQAYSTGRAEIGCTWRTADTAGVYRLTASAGQLTTSIAIRTIARPATLEIVQGPEWGSTWPSTASIDYTLRLRFADGTPAAGYQINAEFRPVTTDASGVAHYRWPLGSGFITSKLITFTVALFPELIQQSAVRVFGQPWYTQLSAGGAHTCASTGTTILNYADWQVLCWGNNAYGQLGDGTTVSRTSPTGARIVLPNADAGYATASAGTSHSCVQRASPPSDVRYAPHSYSFLCWGGNAFGQSGAPPSTTAPAIEMIGAAFSGPAAGATHTCALASQIVCWGDNSFGQLGDGTTVAHYRPADVVNATGLAGVTTGDGFTCATNNDGDAYCWGKNTDGQLGDGTQLNRTTPVLVTGGLHFRGVYAGKAHVCGLSTEKVIYCWGRNDAGQLGDGTTTPRSAPTRVASALSFRQVTAGGAHTCALASSSLAFCWGDNRFGQTGTGTTSNPLIPSAVAGGDTYQGISAGVSHTCAMPDRSRDGAFCWGLNSDGQLGDGTRVNRSTPTRVTDYLSDPPPPPTSQATRVRRP